MSICSIDQACPDPDIHDQAVELWEASGFELRDIWWMLGICAISLSLTPFVAFYLLLVA